MTRKTKTRKQRAVERLGVAQRRYERAVRKHADATKASDAAYVEMTDAATTLAHREQDLALQDAD